MKKYKLRPCPFCGHKKPYVGRHKYHQGARIVCCGSRGGYNCVFFPSSGPIDAEDVDEYVRIWNGERTGKTQPILGGIESGKPAETFIKKRNKH